MAGRLAAMVRRYAHLAVSHLTPYASRTGLLIANNGRSESPAAVATESLGTNWLQHVGARKRAPL